MAPGSTSLVWNVWGWLNEGAVDLCLCVARRVCVSANE